MNATDSSMGSNAPPNKPARAAAAVGDAAHGTADKIAEAANTVASGISSAQQRGSDAIKNASDGMRDGVEAASDTMREQGDRLLGGVRTYTTQNPLLALGLAAGAGIILGRIFRR
jgi:ElaB/YqjD/DUF883 family membrane-anchored ribosome-binding protein